ncbi:MAG: hypothetical protein E4H14_13225 [Candidatus Thorarchaeota archaeon]|nr:MAG: hypothetical protein E4H14_13225 [Candidatus Thorarchaeota archaeon]
MSELKCCKRCGAFVTCTHKGECCVECEHFDPVDILCMAGPERKTKKTEPIEEEVEIDPATFLFEDDDEEDDDDSVLPPERDVDEDDDDEDLFDPADEDDDW